MMKSYRILAFTLVAVVCSSALAQSNGKKRMKALAGGYVYHRTVRVNGKVVDHYIGKSKSAGAYKRRQSDHKRNMKRKYGAKAKVEFKTLGRYRKKALSTAEETHMRKARGRYTLSNKRAAQADKKYRKVNKVRRKDGSLRRAKQTRKTNGRKAHTQKKRRGH